MIALQNIAVFLSNSQHESVAAVFEFNINQSQPAFSLKHYVLSIYSMTGTMRNIKDRVLTKIK